MKIYKHEPIYAGIKCDNKRIFFNWSEDNYKKDALYLIQDTSGEIEKDGVIYVYAYEYSDNVTKDDESIIRDWLKYKIFKRNAPTYEKRYFDKFIDLGINRIEKHINLRKLNGIISIGENSKLLIELSKKTYALYQRFLRRHGTCQINV